jgi:predicted Fe-Mo cluster-binding NifX family protein
MKIVVTANGSNLDAPVSPVFGRCSFFIFVETETMSFEAVPNPAMSARGGAGIQAAQLVVDRGAKAALSGNVGPNASDVLRAAHVPIYLIGEGTVRQLVEEYKAGRLEPASAAKA